MTVRYTTCVLAANIRIISVDFYPRGVNVHKSHNPAQCKLPSIENNYYISFPANAVLSHGVSPKKVKPPLPHTAVLPPAFTIQTKTI
jgi:hypothetical protein